MRRVMILVLGFTVLLCQCQSGNDTSVERRDREEELSRPEAKRQILQRLQPGCSYYVTTGVLGDWNMDVATKIVRAGDTTPFNEQIGFDPSKEGTIRACLGSLEKNGYITDIMVSVEAKTSNSLPRPPYNGERRVYVTFKPTPTFNPFPESRPRCGDNFYPRHYCDPPRLCAEKGLDVGIISIAQEGIRATVEYTYSAILNEGLLSAVRPCHDPVSFDSHWQRVRSGTSAPPARFIRTDVGWRIQSLPRY